MIRKATHHHPCTSLEEWDAVATQINVAKVDLATLHGYNPNMLAFSRKPRLLPSSVDEITDGDTLVIISRAARGDQQLHFLYETQRVARQAAQEVEAKIDISTARNRRCGKV